MLKNIKKKTCFDSFKRISRFLRYKRSMDTLKGTRQYSPRLSVAALGTFELISALLNSSHCLPTDVLPDDEHKARIRNSNKRAYTYVRRSKMRSAHSRTYAKRRKKVKRNACIIGMCLRCNYLSMHLHLRFVIFFPSRSY